VVSRSGSKSRQVADGAPTICHTEHSTLIPALSTSTASVSVCSALLLGPEIVRWVCRSFSRAIDENLASFERDAMAAARAEDSPFYIDMCSSASPTCVMDGCRMLGRAPEVVSSKAARGESRHEAGLNVCCLDVRVWDG
jgi:hypothetical protein